MAKKNKKDSEERPHPIRPGELFVYFTFERLMKSKLGMTGQEAKARFSLELSRGEIEIHHVRCSVKVYVKK